MDFQHKINKYTFKLNSASDDEQRKLYEQKLAYYKTKVQSGGKDEGAGEAKAPESPIDAFNRHVNSVKANTEKVDEIKAKLEGKKEQLVNIINIIKELKSKHEAAIKATEERIGAAGGEITRLERELSTAKEELEKLINSNKEMDTNYKNKLKELGEELKKLNSNIDSTDVDSIDLDGVIRELDA